MNFITRLNLRFGLFVASLLIISLIFVNNSFAANHEERIPDNRNAEQYSAEDRSEAGEMTREEAMERACENIATGITTRNERIVAMASTILEKFDNIVIRVDEFVTENGYEVDGYEDLLVNIDTQKELVEQEMEDAGSTAEEFSCDLSNPREAVIGFNQQMRAVLEALQEYRTSIRELIVEVATSVDDNVDEAEENRQDDQAREDNQTETETE